MAEVAGRKGSSRVVEARAGGWINHWRVQRVHVHRKRVDASNPGGTQSIGRVTCRTQDRSRQKSVSRRLVCCAWEDDVIDSVLGVGDRAAF